MMKDPMVWMQDLSVHIDDEDLLQQAAALEPTVFYSGSRVVAAVWVSLVSAIAGAFAGATFGDEVRASWASFAVYLVVSAAILRALHPVSVRIVGPTVTWHVILSFFWSVLLAMVALAGARIDTVWLGTTTTIVGGLFVGLMYGSFSPGFIKREEAWMFSALPLGPLATWSATSLQRAFDATGTVNWSEAYVGTMAATAFMVPMAVLMATLSSRSAGLVKMATLYLHNQNFTAKAIELLNEAIEISPRSADLHNLRGIAYSKLGDADRADEDFRQVSQLSPRAAEAHMNRGVDFIRQGDYARAIEALNLATTINPKLATAFSNMGTAYQKKGELDAAIASYTRAIEIRAKYPIAFSNRAYSQYLKGNHDLAVADATRALELDEDLPMAHLNLGHALAGKGDVALAIRSYQRALALSPDREVEEEALQALEKLGASIEDAEEADG